MTSAPVSVSTNAYYSGQMTTGTSASTDVETSFSDVLKNQRSEGEVKGPEKASQSKKDVKTDEVSKTPEKESEPSVKETDEKEVVETKAKDAEETVAEVADDAAEKMVKEVAEELGMTEEEVLEILNGLNMVPTDLLNVENLQAVVLAAAGETDLSSFVTNEELFTSFKNLTQSLEEVISEVSKMTGVEEAEVKDIFQNLMEGNKETAALENEMPQTVQAQDEETDVAAEGLKTENETTKTNETAEDGAEVILERSLETAQSQNAATDGNAQDAPQNPFAQNQNVQTIQTNMTETMQSVQATQSYFDDETMRIMNQITDYMKGQVTDGVSELEMQLNPESLGSLHIKLTAKEGVVTAQFTAQNDIVKNVLETQMIQLKETFKEQGVTVEAIEVMVESHRFDENMSRNNGENMQENNRNSARSQSRRINLNSLDFEEENLTQEEQLAAEMLRENGGTVDYTA